MIPVIKIGNDFNLRLIVRRGDGTVEDFDGVEKIEVQAVKNGAAWVTVLPNSYYYGIDGIVVAKFVADNTQQEGEYRVKVIYTKDGRRYLAENCQAFLLTTCCSQLSIDTAESIDVTLDVQFSADGKDGLSAYELAVANEEYTGDYSGYQEWLASLAGEVSVESANEYTDEKLKPINEYLNSIKNNIVKKNGDVEIKANDTVYPATAKIFVNQNSLDLEVEGKGINIDGSGTEFTGYHPIVNYADILPYSKYFSTIITTCKNIEQKFNNFDFIRTVSDPNVTDEDAGGKIYNEIRSTSGGHQLDIAVYPTNGVNRGEHNVDEASTRIKMDAYGIIDVVSKDGKITIDAPSVALKGDARYNPKNFPSSQSIINRKYADSRFIYWCNVDTYYHDNYDTFKTFISNFTSDEYGTWLLLSKMKDGSGICVFLGEMVGGKLIESRLLYDTNYFIFRNVPQNNWVKDDNKNNIQKNVIYKIDILGFDSSNKYLTTGLNIIPAYSNKTEALDNLAKGAGVLMGSVFWNYGLQSVDTRFVDLNNISAGEKSGNISIPDASSTTKGFMSSADKKKLDGINTDGSIYRGLYEAAGAVYNEETGLYSLSGLDDLTEEQILESYVDTMLQVGGYPMRSTRVRTFFPIPYTHDLRYWYFAASKLESVQIRKEMDVNTYSIDQFGGYCSKLKKVLDVINVENVSDTSFNIFRNSPLVEYFRIKNLKKNAVISDCPLLTLDTVSYLVDNAANTSAITVQVHPDVYAKLTDSTNTEWYAVNTAAQAKQISFATTDAQAAAISLMNAEEPAIIQETTGELTEIAAPAGYYLTQAGDTDGRMYFTMKVFVEGDSVGNYRMATAQEYEVYKIEQENNLYNG